MTDEFTDEDIKQLIQKYQKEIKEYSELVLVLVTLKKILQDISKKTGIKAGIYIEDIITYMDATQPKSPDLIILEHEKRIGAALDHKYVRARSERAIRHVINDVLKYRGIALINNTQYSITDCFIIIPEKYLESISDILFDIIIKDRYEIAIISYSPNYDQLKILFKLHNPNNVRISSEIMKAFFIKRVRKADVPPQAHYQYKFIKQSPPLSYLLVEVYHLLLEGGVDPLSPTITIQFKALLERVKTFYPRWITHKDEYEQIPRDRLYLAIRILENIGIVEVKGSIIKAKKPRKPAIEYVLEKLAMYEIKQKKHKILKTQPKYKTLDEFLEK